MSLKRISGLWLKDGQSGKFMSGKTETPIPAGTRLLVFKNDRKQKDSDPDYVLNLATDDEHAEKPEPNAFRQRAEQKRQGETPPSAF